MHFGDGLVVVFADDGKKRKGFDYFVDGGRHDVGGNDHGSMPDEV